MAGFERYCHDTTSHDAFFWYDGASPDRSVHGRSGTSSCARDLKTVNLGKSVL